MKIYLLLSIFSFVMFTSIFGAEEPQQLGFDSELKQEEQEIEKLENELHERTRQYNEKLAQKVVESPAKQESVHKREHQVNSTLEKRVADLEEELVRLKSSPDKSSRPSTEAEIQATKKAEENAPTLATNSPAVAQYNQALSLFKNNELEKARVAFQQIIDVYSEDIYAAKSYLHLGDIQLQLKNFGEAEKYYKESLLNKLETPLMVKARLGLAKALLQLNKQDDCCQQMKVIQKEILDDSQKKDLENLFIKVDCAKIKKDETDNSKKGQK